MEDLLEDQQSDHADNHGKEKIEKILTAPTVDYVAENYRSKWFVILFWLSVVVTYFAYLFGLEPDLKTLDCTGDDPDLGNKPLCEVLSSVLLWTEVLLQLG